MIIEYTQKTRIGINEFGWETYNLPEDPLSDKNKDKIKYDGNLAEKLLKNAGCVKVTRDTELKRADSHEADNWKAYSIWSFIYGLGIRKLSSALNDALRLDSQYEEIFNGFLTIGNWTRESSRIFIYRDSKSKGIVKLSNNDKNIPTMQIEATPEVDLGSVVEKMRMHVTFNLGVISSE